MSVQPTQPAEVVSLAQQRIVLTVLGLLADRYPALPAAYITVQQHTVKVHVQLDSGAAFEVWREALQIHPARTALHLYAGQVWISTETVIRSVLLELSADVPVPEHVAKVSPQEDADRRARVAAVAARHQQQAAPVTLAPVAPVDVMPLANRPGGAS